MNLRNILGVGAILGTTACASLPLVGRSIEPNLIKEGCVEGMPVRIFYDSSRSNLILRINSPDGTYLEAEDVNHKVGGGFDFIAHSRVPLNHSLTRYRDF